MSKYIGTPVVNVSVDTVDVTGDITTTDSTPEVIIVNNTHEDTDGGREGKVTFKGQQSGGEETTLAQIQASHDGTLDDEKGDLIFKTNDGSDGASPTEAMRIDSDQNILVGAGNTSSVNVGNGTGAVQIADTSATPISALRYNNSAGGPFIMLGHSRSTTVGTLGTVVSSGDDLGTIRFCGDDGTDVNSVAAAIVAEVDGTPGSNDMPGRLKFETTADGSDSTTERMRIDSSGLVSIGNAIASSFNSGANNLVVGTGSGSEGITIYGGNESNIFFADGTDIADNLRGRIEYSHLSESMLFYIDNTYAMRINDGQALLLGLNNPLFSQTIGLHTSSAAGGSTAHFNRTGDGGVVRIGSDGTEEGSISVSGSTVSYNGGHLARWSQATDGNRIDGLVKGTVMTNLDQMAVWHHEDKAATYYEEGDGLPEGVSVGDEKTPFVAAHDEENEQLNCMAVSSVEGDANVAGVFVNWDDDAVFTADMNIAMTGDMVIRIASGTTVARGDLLMSAGDGTAKPQGDDIVRSKTIAKVTSTTKSHTYDDGSYLVPCVLMAC